MHTYAYVYPKPDDITLCSNDSQWADDVIESYVDNYKEKESPA